MEERSILVSPNIEEAEAIVNFAVTDWRWGARRLEREAGIRKIAARYELRDRGTSERYLLEVRLEEQAEEVLVSWRYPGKAEELMMASPQLIDFLRTGLFRALKPYQVSGN